MIKRYYTIIKGILNIRIKYYPFTKIEQELNDAEKRYYHKEYYNKIMDTYIK